MKIKISPAKLEVGGAAIFPILNKNHHNAIKGLIVIILRIKINLRVANRS